MYGGRKFWREERAEREVLEAKCEYLQRLGRETSLLVDKGDSFRLQFIFLLIRLLVFMECILREG